jgi:hypothetical protein
MPKINRYLHREKPIDSSFSLDVDVQHCSDEYSDNKRYRGNPKTDYQHLGKASPEGKILGHRYIKREQEYYQNCTQQGEHESIIRAGKDQEWQDEQGNSYDIGDPRVD